MTSTPPSRLERHSDVVVVGGSATGLAAALQPRKGPIRLRHPSGEYTHDQVINLACELARGS